MLYGANQYVVTYSNCPFVYVSGTDDHFQKQPVTRAYVFGSVARGDQTDASDIDILVELDYGCGADFYQFITMQEQLSELFGKPVDLISVNGLSPFIKPYIDREKQLIYEKVA